MNKTVAFFFLLMSFSCGTKTKQVKETFATVKNEEAQLPEGSFNIELQIDKVDGELYSFSTSLELDSGAYVVSPFSEDEFYGPFQISILDSRHLIIDERLLEIPKSVEENDPYINVPVRFVRENTIYKQNIKLLTEEDFEVSGLIEFVLEPSCKPYSVEFILSYHSDTMTIEKTKTSIDYKIYR